MRLLARWSEHPPRGSADEDATGFQPIAKFPAVHLSGSLVAASHPAGSVGGGEEGVTTRHTCENVRSGAHRAGDQDRLTD
jgi:hypothetical protein